MLREARLKASAARLSVAAAAFLIVLKTATGLLTGSISVWASLLDSTMDIFASVINYFAVRAASRPPDDDHHYGHGKAESLAGLFQSFVITVSGIFLIREAVRRVMTPHATALEWVGVGTMAVAGAVSVALVTRLRKVAKETDSPALAADSVHYTTDVFTNGAALVALLVVALTGWTLADPLFSIAISAFILWSAFEVARDAVNVLMDRKLGPEVDDAVAAVVESFRDRGVTGFHDLRTRRSGSYKFIDFTSKSRRQELCTRARPDRKRHPRHRKSDSPLPRPDSHRPGDPARFNHRDTEARLIEC